jgi:large subunit ribosomal protein L18
MASRKNIKERSRIRRAKKTRSRQRHVVRLCINKTSRHMYAQVLSAGGASVLASASTVESAVRSELNYTGNKEGASLVGKLIAERALKEGITTLVFDRSGFPYHGRVKALADAVREHGVTI